MSTRVEGAFAPFTPSEVGVVLNDLLGRVERNPSVATNPAFVGVVRLAVTASGHARPGVQIMHPPVVPAPAPTTPPAPPPSLQDLADQAAEAVDLMRKHGITVDKDALTRLRALLNEGSGTADARISSLESEKESLWRQLTIANETTRDLARQAETTKSLLETARRKLLESERENTTLREQAAAARRDEADAKGQLRAAQEMTVQTRQEVEAARTETRRVAKEAILRILRQLEWSQKSTQYTVRTTGRPVPCCPSCLGIDPSGITPGKHVGHQKGCYLAKLIQETAAQPG